MTTGEPDARVNPFTGHPASGDDTFTQPFILFAGADNYEYLCTDLSIS